MSFIAITIANTLLTVWWIIMDLSLRQTLSSLATETDSYRVYHIKYEHGLVILCFVFVILAMFRYQCPSLALGPLYI